jgi:hypothetical protein
MNAISRPQRYATAPYCVEQRVHGATRWVAVRARGAESSLPEVIRNPFDDLHPFLINRLAAAYR